MKIISQNPILVEGQFNPTDYFSAATADEGKATGTYVPTEAEINSKHEKGFYWNKAKGVWEDAKAIGLVDKVGGWLGLNMENLASNTNPKGNNFDPKDEPKGISTGAIIGISVGALAVIAILYFALRKK